MVSRDSLETPPVQEGDIVELEFLSKGAKGDAVAKIGKFVVMVKDANIGEKRKVRITRVIRNMAFGEIAED